MTVREILEKHFSDSVSTVELDAAELELMRLITSLQQKQVEEAAPAEPVDPEKLLANKPVTVKQLDSQLFKYLKEKLSKYEVEYEPLPPGVRPLAVRRTIKISRTGKTFKMVDAGVPGPKVLNQIEEAYKKAMQAQPESDIVEE